MIKRPSLKAMVFQFKQYLLLRLICTVFLVSFILVSCSKKAYLGTYVNQGLDSNTRLELHEDGTFNYSRFNQRCVGSCNVLGTGQYDIKDYSLELNFYPLPDSFYQQFISVFDTTKSRDTNNVKISLQVLDNDSPLIFAAISVDSLSISGTTDSNGYVELDIPNNNLPASLCVQYVGYPLVFLPLKKNQDATIIVKMKTSGTGTKTGRETYSFLKKNGLLHIKELNAVKQ